MCWSVCGNVTNILYWRIIKCYDVKQTSTLFLDFLFRFLFQIFYKSTTNRQHIFKDLNFDPIADKLNKYYWFHRGKKCYFSAWISSVRKRCCFLFVAGGETASGKNEKKDELLTCCLNASLRTFSKHQILRFLKTTDSFCTISISNSFSSMQYTYAAEIIKIVKPGRNPRTIHLINRKIYSIY